MTTSPARSPLFPYEYSIKTKDGKSHNIVIVELDSSRVEAARKFCCGEEEQDRFIREDAWIHQKVGFNKTLLFLEGEEICGYVTYGISRIRVPRPDIYDKEMTVEHKKPEPLLVIAQYAIEKSRRGNGMGPALLEFVKEHVFLVALQVGGVAVSLHVVMDYLGEARIRMYENGGFVKLTENADDENKIQMLHPLDFIRKGYYGY